MTETSTSSPATNSAPGRTMIRLENLGKQYPKEPKPAVDNLTLEIPEGEIVILVGPSGCGKTTTMKMINRIIEPTSGRIILDGEDVTTTDPDKLRRKIGYVIQQIGLFPHMTIAENIATVPKLLGWDKKKIDARIDELLQTVSMAPETYRNRYPKQLSGGQRQRVGVARALSGDPAVMLMDEPFGAIDPITRDRLQNEFLRLQAEVRKTIVFVTHDIDEAIKMGDRIAILQEGSRIAQYDTPEQILTAPADDFVADFIGRGASLKRLNLTRVRDIQLSEWPTVQMGDEPARVMDVLRASDKGFALVLDENRKPRRWISAPDLQRNENLPLDQIGLPPEAVVEPQATLNDALNELITANYSVAIVVNARGEYQGIVDIDSINEAIRTMRTDARARAREGLLDPRDEAEQVGRLR
ncbi:MAG: betaine/proline/choline family ABC transporter ATP-binding protein [Geodermatophilaceae bacterium]